MQRFLTATIAALVAMIAPLAAQAAATPTLDSLWSQPQGLSMDSALYAVQAWWDGSNNELSNNPTQRGFDELNRANADLLNAYTLLEHAHAGAQPVAILDPLVSSVYNTVTGSNVKAPLGALFGSVNQSLLSLEGRGSNSDQVAALLQEYRAMQAAALRDLHGNGTTSYDALIASNAQREADFLTQVQRVSTPEDGLASLLADATLQTATVAHHQSLTALAGVSHDPGKGNGHAYGNANGHGNGNAGGHGQGQGAGKGNPPSNPSGTKK
jgi:hypothetical protein